MVSELLAPDLIVRLSALSEESVLAYFWLMLRNDAVDRLELLSQLSQVVIQRPLTWDRRAIRREHEQQGGIPLRADVRCFGCLTTERRRYYHHVVEVQHGGSNNSRNIVPLCFRCHHHLHPWLIELNLPTDGFEPTRRIMPRAFGQLERQK